MTADYYKYIGDETGTDLENRVYRVVRRGINTVTVEDANRERTDVFREEWQTHLDLGTLAPRDGF